MKRSVLIHTFLFIVMFSFCATAQTMVTNAKEAEKKMNVAAWFLGRITRNYDLPYAPVVLVLDDETQILLKGRKQDTIIQKRILSR
ncbi:MAG: hypothetical protein IAF38_10400 [Bacteroidia bacterium]|nr:hypothetical protein [Bacteroidia bacterium]